MGPTVDTLKCPQCAATLVPPGRFARQAVCSFCGSVVVIDPDTVSVSRFREAYRRWCAPETYGADDWIALGDSRWLVRDRVARGDVADVFAADRLRWPGESALLKVVRDPGEGPLIDAEWSVLSRLRSDQPALPPHVAPEPIACGTIAHGPLHGLRALAVRRPAGSFHTFEAVREQYPAGVPARAGVWIWRRILESLAALHRLGIAHAALVPAHLLVEENDHGVRLVGFGRAGPFGGRPRRLPGSLARFHERRPGEELVAGPAADVRMSARCMAWILGGDPVSGSVPPGVPAAMAALIGRLAASADEAGTADLAWTLRNQIGDIGRAAFGRPSFNPLVMAHGHGR